MSPEPIPPGGPVSTTPVRLDLPMGPIPAAWTSARPLAPPASVSRRADRGGPTHARAVAVWRYCAGVVPVCRLNAALNDDFALNPASIPMARTVHWA